MPIIGVRCYGHEGHVSPCSFMNAIVKSLFWALVPLPQFLETYSSATPAIPPNAYDANKD